MNISVVALRTAKPRNTASVGLFVTTDANHDAPTSCDAHTSSSAPSRTTPATIIITNENRRCFQKLRVFSTPQAWLTAVVIAPNTPSDPQMRPTLPAAP